MLAARALFNLGFTLVGWGREPEEVEAAYRDAAAAGREAATLEGLVETARALFNLGNALVGWGREPEEVEAAYCDAVVAGQEAATPAGLLLSAQALFNFGLALASWGRPEQEVETAYRDAAAAGREAATPEGLVEAARILVCLGSALADWGRGPQEFEAALREAAEAARESATPEGAEVLELVSSLLREPSAGTRSKLFAIAVGPECVLGGGNCTILWTAVDGADDYEAQHQIAGEEEWTAPPATQETSETLRSNATLRSERL